MKIEWEANDIVCGQRVGSLLRDERWIIGYNPVSGSKAIISLSDGLIAAQGDSQHIADALNKNGDAPVELIDRPRRPIK